ncbi:MAG: aminoglycoside 6'-N-acetyltransferase [Acutalibacteraceae bacterium]|jgi:aminoglycoside 6'-N-acetyltransferase I
MIKPITGDDLHTVTQLALKLWPDNDYDILFNEFKEMIENKNSLVVLFFKDQRAVAFAHCELRHDYVEGTASSPVGYLEAIYVEKDCRLQGIASALVRYCEDWARSKNCTEFASDCELNNLDSLRFHLKYGFSEANRIICFTKKL